MLKNDPLWFKDAIIYEVPVRAFADSNGDGIGDLQGLTEKLDYLQDLGVTAIWTLPFFPSPLRDDGYDIADYRSINSIYGNIEDFQQLLDAAHDRGIRVIIELVVNHTSDKHPWFQRARRAPKGSVERDFYVWSDSADKFPEVRIIFQDFENSNWAWDSVAQAYYWHRFFYHQPDLNYENPAVQEAVLELADFWLSMGVDGMRLDAVPYLCVEEGTNCENLPGTHVFLKKLRGHIDSKYPNRMLLAEANQWPEDAAKYYGAGDECHMNFHFPLMPRLFMALRMEDNFPISDILKQTPSIPNNCQWALFLRNHDELTLEMVSDEDRDYMYKAYAQDPQARINLGIRRRLSPLLGNDRRQIELLNSLLLSLPGTPVLYYGDEIGMGDNIYLGDRNGVRTPMQWTADRNAGFSRTNPQKLYAPVIVDPEYHYETINVEAQQANSNSLWWWMKRLISTRERFQAFGRGSFELLHPENRKVLAFTRTYSGQHILVVANLSRFVQIVELDLSAFNGMVPVEIFGRTKFPAIEENPYFFSLSPYAFYWFTLQPQQSYIETPKPLSKPPVLTVAGNWKDIFSQAEIKSRLESILPNYLSSFPWFGGKNKVIQSTEITEVISINYQQKETALIFLELNYTEGSPETYLIALSYLIPTEITPQIPREKIIAELQIQQQEKSGILFDVLGDREFLNMPFDAIAQNQKYQGNKGVLRGKYTDVLAEIMQTNTGNINPHISSEKHDKTLINFGTGLIFKLLRKLEIGINPDLEVGKFLTDKSRSQNSEIAGNIPQIAGYLEYHQQGNNLMTIGILEEFIPEARDGWSYTSSVLRDYFDRIMVENTSVNELEIPQITVSNSLNTEITESVYDVIGSYINVAENLGKVTADIHCTLASDLENPNFAPEQFTPFYQRSVYQYMRNQTGRILLKLKKHLSGFSQDKQQLAKNVINRQDQIMKHLGSVVERKITAMRTRCHGDYHLENVLFTGKDFVVVNFEGEGVRPLNERRMKRSLLRDIAIMLESFYYAANVALREEIKNGMIRPENLLAMEQWSTFWYSWTSISFLKAYLNNTMSSSFLPKTEEEIQVLLDVYLLEKVVYELDYELTYRPEFVEIPLARIQQLIP
ncbi:MAG: maltose alpha-D-glucosyltransferase [Okeania sp. SIO2C9]|uniref:maltose alpha-D-glucosyltransferase n=1 Tax=Okeania sp. SIO2C9 TaxID=2607791 RepID=UPI0013C16C22|nr:maltose alpha-D-glucosyltransferase [Okeania sp. SIO2C9]NEQ72921.1 maltose alpha-D-glucosyltransferase [Okeania sp. SIO2C9]